MLEGRDPSFGHSFKEVKFLPGSVKKTSPTLSTSDSATHLFLNNHKHEIWEDEGPIKRDEKKVASSKFYTIKLEQLQKGPFLDPEKFRVSL